MTYRRQQYEKGKKNPVAKELKEYTPKVVQSKKHLPRVKPHEIEKLLDEYDAQLKY